MVINYRLLSDVFNLSSLSRALEDDVKAQPSHPAAHIFDAFNLSSLSRALDEDIVAQIQAEEDYGRMDVDDEWRGLSFILTGVIVLPPVEYMKHKPAAPTRKGENLHTRAGINVTTTSCSSKVKVEDRGAAEVKRSKVTVGASNQIPKQSDNDEDFFLTSKGQTPNLAISDRWLKVSRTPGHNLDNDSVLPEDASMDKSHLGVAYPFVDDVRSIEESTTDMDFFLVPNNEISIDDDWLKTSRTPGRNLDDNSVLPKDASIDQSYLAVAYPLIEGADEVEESVGDEDLFLVSSRETPDPTTDDEWLKVSRIPGRNLDNDSVLLEDASIDKSYLAVAHPLMEDEDSDEGSTTDEDFFLTSRRGSSNCAVNDRWLRSYLAVAYPLVENTDPIDQSTSNEDFFLTSSRDSPNRGAENCWLKVSRTPGRNVDNDSVLPEDATVDKSYLAIAYPLVEDADSIEQSASNNGFFLASHLESSDPADDDCWLKTSRTPGRNVDNDSVLPEDATIDKSYLALAYPLKEDRNGATTSEDGASGRNVSVQRVDDVEFFDAVAQSTPTKESKHRDESQGFAPQVTSTPVASRVEEEDSIFFRELKAEINVSGRGNCMQQGLIKGATLDLVPGSNGGLNVFTLDPVIESLSNTEVLALCRRLQGSSSAPSSASSIFKFFEDSALFGTIWPWIRFISSLDFSMLQYSSLSLLSGLWDSSKSIGRYLSNFNF
ncbi:hypothetical protein F5887DRAFT_1068781 [Amanita rubescens]|nr:hypothetical protein F5887DRAFT_1068781 [Amanita rubescens]